MGGATFAVPSTEEMHDDLLMGFTVPRWLKWGSPLREAALASSLAHHLDRWSCNKLQQQISPCARSRHVLGIRIHSNRANKWPNVQRILSRFALGDLLPSAGEGRF